MTPDEVTARNRANAAKSTGPRTAQGRAIVAGNALQHGATAQPDPESVAAWLAVILDRPGITPSDLMPTDDRGMRALVLAEAEARLVRAEDALSEFEAGVMDSNETAMELDDMARRIVEHVLFHAGTMTEVRSGASLVRRIDRALRIVERDGARGGKRHRLLRRYVREARAARHKAFAAWAAAVGEVEKPDHSKPKPP